MVEFDDVINNAEIKEMMKNAQKQLDVLGYTEHSARHCLLVAQRAGFILQTLGYDKHRIELAKIAGYIGLSIIKGNGNGYIGSNRNYDGYWKS